MLEHLEWAVKMINNSVTEFYDQLSEYYHLIFEDWDSSIKKQAKILDAVIQAQIKQNPPSIALLDCSCGIGTQAIGLSLLGYKTHATDLSSKAIERAKDEANRLGAKITFNVADFRKIKFHVNGLFDVIITCDNSLPHLLNRDDLQLALKSMSEVLNVGGLFLASIRNYDEILTEKPRFTTPSIFDGPHGKRIVFQMWDWDLHEPIYLLTQFIIQQNDKNGWNTRHSSTKYRAITRDELSAILDETGFIDIHWHDPNETGYYQPIVTAFKR